MGNEQRMQPIPYDSSIKLLLALQEENSPANVCLLVDAIGVAEGGYCKMQDRSSLYTNNVQSEARFGRMGDGRAVLILIFV